MAIYLSAPKAKTQLGTNTFYRTFQTILSNGIGPDYAIYSTLIPQLHSGMTVVVFDRDQRLRAEGTLAGYAPTTTTGSQVQRYSLSIANLHSVPYTPPPAVNRCGVAII